MLYCKVIEKRGESMSIDALQTRIRRTKNPSMIGLDPTIELLPPHLLAEAYAEQGQTLEAVAQAYQVFCEGILEELADLVPAVKFQSYCFEALGAAGVAVMQDLMKKATDMGLYVLLDANYGSVGHISQLYAASVFGGLRTADGNCLTPYCCDGVSVSGYLGSDGVKPFLPYCKEQGKNLFLYVKTSNKSSREVQDLVSGDRLVYSAMADLAMRWSTGLFGKCDYSQIVAVAGATFPGILRTLRQKYPQLFLMVPGYGAQGGTAKQVSEAFDRFGHGAIVSASRSIIGAWQKAGTDGTDWAVQARIAAEKMRQDISKYVTVM